MTIREYLAHLQIHLSGTAASLYAAAKAVRDAACMRMLEVAAQELTAALRRDGGIKDPLPLAMTLIDQAEMVLAANQSDSARPVAMSGASRRALEKAIKAQSGEQSTKISYGIQPLDSITYGMEPGQLIILGGRPAMGKTAVALSIALANGSAERFVPFFSQEMTAEDLAERALSAQMYRMGHVLPYTDLAAGLFDAEQAAMLVEAQRQIDQMPLWIDPRPGRTVGQIIGEARKRYAIAREKGQELGPMIVDYLGLVRASDRFRGNRVHELGEITGALKGAAKELGVPCILLAQLSRQVEQRDDKRPQLADLRDSGEIEQDADVVVFVYRDEYYAGRVDMGSLDPQERDAHMKRLMAGRNKMELIVAKQRKGSTGIRDAFCDISCNYVSGIQHEG